LSQERAVTLVVPSAHPNRPGELDAAARASEAFRTELVAMIPRLRGYAMALTRSNAEADDLVQDALLRAWRFRGGYQPGGNLAAWLSKILRNTYYTAVRARWNTVQDVDGQHAAQFSCEPDQEWRLKHGELMSALGQLTGLMREALLLVVAQGLSYEEAAEVSGCPVGTMKSRVNRGRQRLAQIMGEEPAPRRVRPPQARSTPPIGRPPGRSCSQWLAASSAA
jgi:RNA polymerase sigma-70 factor (ECF subfamily)